MVDFFSDFSDGSGSVCDRQKSDFYLNKTENMLLVLLMLFYLHKGSSILLYNKHLNRNYFLKKSFSLFASKNSKISNNNNKQFLVSIPASDVAACIGRNPYKASSDVFNELWKRWSPDTFTGKTKIDEQLEAIATTTKEEQNLLWTAAKTITKDAESAMKTFNETSTIIESSATLKQEDKQKVLDLMKTMLSTSHGTRTEGKIAQKLAMKQGVTITRDNTLYSIPLITLGDDNNNEDNNNENENNSNKKDFIVRGKIDRLSEEGGEIILVEVKSRMNRLFKELRDYEHIQIQAYLQMLPDIKRAKLVEQYMDETHEIWIEKDDDMWQQEIEPALLSFCIELHAAMTGMNERNENEM